MLQPKTEKNDKLKEVPEKKKRKKILLVFFLLLMVIAILVWLNMQKPVVSRNIRVIEPAIEKKSEAAKERFESRYLSFVHSSSYKLKNHEEADEANRVLERAFFAEEGVNSKKIALTVSHLESGNLEENADYTMRKTFPKKYKKGRFEKEEITAVVFSVNEASYFEKVYFLIKDGYLAEIAFSAPFAENQELENEADAIAGSVRWKSE